MFLLDLEKISLLALVVDIPHPISFGVVLEGGFDVFGFLLEGGDCSDDVVVEILFDDFILELLYFFEAVDFLSEEDDFCVG